MRGNFVEDAPEVTANNKLGIHLGREATAEEKINVEVDKPFSVVNIQLQSAKDAYTAILNGVGASYRRDTMDQRIIREVKDRTGIIIDVQGHFPHGTPYEQTIHAWPHLASLPAPADADQDGMPDEWEKKNGLDPANASDAAGNKLDKHYTNIEVYINSLTKG